jgi:hypothetical protein
VTRVRKKLFAAVFNELFPLRDILIGLKASSTSFRGKIVNKTNKVNKKLIYSVY